MWWFVLKRDEAQPKFLCISTAVSYLYYVILCTTCTFGLAQTFINLNYVNATQNIYDKYMKSMHSKLPNLPKPAQISDSAL